MLILAAQLSLPLHPQLMALRAEIAARRMPGFFRFCERDSWKGKPIGDGSRLENGRASRP
jgi:hypothetical protein